MGMERRYFPGTVFPERTTLTDASGMRAPLRMPSMVRYSTLSAPASSAAPAMERDIGEMYGGTPSAAGSSMYPSIRRTEISLLMVDASNLAILGRGRAVPRSGATPVPATRVLAMGVPA